MVDYPALQVECPNSLQWGADIHVYQAFVLLYLQRACFLSLFQFFFSEFGKISSIFAYNVDLGLAA